MLAIAFAALVALDAYFRQKEYELIKQRYLEGAVDAAAAALSSTTAIVSFNYARCLEVTKAFRDSDEHFDVKSLDNVFAQFKPLDFLEVAHFRIRSLVQSNVFWELFQLATAYCQGANYFLTFEAPQVIRIKCTTAAIQTDRRTIANEIAEEARSRHDGMFRFSLAVTALQTLARILESQKLGDKAIGEIHRRADVVRMVRELEELVAMDAAAEGSAGGLPLDEARTSDNDG